MSISFSSSNWSSHITFYGFTRSKCPVYHFNFNQLRNTEFSDIYSIKECIYPIIRFHSFSSKLYIPRSHIMNYISTYNSTSQRYCIYFFSNSFLWSCSLLIKFYTTFSFNLIYNHISRCKYLSSTYTNTTSIASPSFWHEFTYSSTRCLLECLLFIRQSKFHFYTNCLPRIPFNRRNTHSRTISSGSHFCS